MEWKLREAKKVTRINFSFRRSMVDFQLYGRNLNLLIIIARWEKIIWMIFDDFLQSVYQVFFWSKCKDNLNGIYACTMNRRILFPIFNFNSYDIFFFFLFTFSSVFNYILRNAILCNWCVVQYNTGLVILWNITAWTPRANLVSLRTFYASILILYVFKMIIFLLSRAPSFSSFSSFSATWCRHRS